MWRSRLSWILGGGSLALLGVGFSFTRTPRADMLLRDGRVFEFRDAVLSMKSPSSFYRGALAYTFHEWSHAERELRSSVQSAPFWSRQAFSAADLLENIYSLSGRNADGVAQYDSLGWRSIFWEIKKYRIRKARGDLSVDERGYSRIPYAAVDNGIYIPITISGRPANYHLDTGSSDSFISESEAHRLGLTVDPYEIDVQGYSTSKQVTGIAVAPEVIIGKFRLRNVSFLVESDDDVGTDGNLLGLPVMLALETWRWGPDGILEIGFPPQPFDPEAANLALSEVSLITRGAFGNDQLDLFVDTGANTTGFYPRFQKQYTEYVRLFGHQEPLEIDDTVTDQHGTIIPALPLRVGDLDRILRPARVFSLNPEPNDASLHGAIGMDFLSLAATVTLDFRAMRLTLAGDGVIREDKGDLVNCSVPQSLSCPVGWTCTIHGGAGGCWLDRLPEKAWPGNSILDGSQQGGHQLERGFHLAEGKAISIGFDRRPTK